MLQKSGMQYFNKWFRGSSQASSPEKQSTVGRLRSQSLDVTALEGSRVRLVVQNVIEIIIN